MAGYFESLNRTVIREAPQEIVETATASVTFFSNPDNLRLVECFLWLLWVLLVVALAFVFRRLFICVRRSSEEASPRRRKRADDDAAFELGSFRSRAGNADGFDGAASSPAPSYREDGNAVDGGEEGRARSSTAASSPIPAPPWAELRTPRGRNARSVVHNLVALFGIVFLYFLICYVLTIVSIVTFIKFTEDAEIFGRGVKCPNKSSAPTSQSLTSRESFSVVSSDLALSDAVADAAADLANSSAADAATTPDPGPVYANGRGFCDYSLSLAHEEAFLQTAHGDTIHVWWIPRTSNGSLTAVLHHGAIGLMNQYGPAYERLTAFGVNVAGYDYPFYGRSTGLPSESALYAAADAVSKFARRRGFVTDLSDIIHIGNSLGGPVALEMARRYDSKAVILISAMDNSFKVVNHFLRLTGWVVNWFIKYYYDGFGKIADFKGCLFNYVALRDTIIPPDRGRDLWRQATGKDPACSILVENPYCGHTCENYLFPEFVEMLEKFLLRVRIR